MTALLELNEQHDLAVVCHLNIQWGQSLQCLMHTPPQTHALLVSPAAYHSL